jgi:uncharacterized membrane protein
MGLWKLFHYYALGRAVVRGPQVHDQVRRAARRPDEAPALMLKVLVVCAAVIVALLFLALAVPRTGGPPTQGERDWIAEQGQAFQDSLGAR